MNAEIDTQAPNFTLKNTAGDEVSLESFKGEKNVVLLFFPLAFSSVCTEELCTTRHNMKLYSSMEAEVIAVSVDSFYALRAFKKAENLNFMLLSDFNREVSRRYRVLNDDYHGMKEVSKRAVFVIDKEGIIKHREIVEESRHLPDFKQIQMALSAIQRSNPVH